MQLLRLAVASRSYSVRCNLSRGLSQITRSFRLPLTMICIVGLISSCGSAQSESASLSGFVTDSTGAVIVGSQVQVVNVQTNVSNQTKTNSAGLYLFPNLRPGEYRLSVSSSGFKQAIRQGLILHVQDTISQNFKLEVGSATETVSVVADQIGIDTADGTVSTIVDRQFVQGLPLNGRSFQTLLLLTPGAVVVPTNYALQGQFSFNGQRADSNYFTVDGVSANNGVAGGLGLQQSGGGSMPGLTALGGTQSMVSADAVQEFRVQTSTFAPEFGRTPGGQVNIATRSGSNQWHGTAFEYLRNDVLDANNWFADHNHATKPKERQNDFGGVFGGPILKDHTFFFFSYEGLRLRQPVTATTLVPSNSAKALLPTSVKPLVSLFPVSNNPDLGNGTATLTASYSNPATVDAYSIRIDHTFGAKTTIFGRYSDSPSESSQRSPNGVLSATIPGIFRTRTMTLGLSDLITPHVSNEIRGNYSNSRAGSTASLDTFGGANPQDTAALFQLLNFPTGFTPQNALLSIGVTSAGASLAAGKNSINEQRQVNVVDTLSTVIGAHQIKVGVDDRWLAPFSGQRNYLQILTFSGVLGGNGTLQSGVAQSALIFGGRSTPSSRCKIPIIPLR